MNATTYFNNKKRLLFFLIGINFSGYAQKINFPLIETVVNTDSLEKHLNPSQPQNYVRQLLNLEHNWYKSSHAKFGTKLEAIYTLANDMKWTDALATYQLYKGRLFVKNRQHTEALTTFTESLNTFEKTKDTLGIVRACVGLSDLNINQIQDKLRNFEAGTEYAKKAVSIAERQQDATTLLMALGCLTVVYSYGEKNQKLRQDLLNRQLNIINQNPVLEKNRVTFTINFASLYAQFGDMGKAYQLLLGVREKARKQLTPYNYAMFLKSFAYVCTVLNKNEEAKIYLDEALPITRGKELRLLRLEVFEGYRVVYLSRQDFKNALIYSDSAYTLKDVIYREENIQKLNQLETTYKTKEVKSQNASLTKENELLKSRNQTIMIGFVVATLLTLLLLLALYYVNKSRKQAQIQVAEINKLSHIRDQYIKIIAHDIRSPLFAMQGMYDVLKKAISTKKYSDIEKITNYIDETGVNTSHLLDNLLNWGMSQQEEIPYNPEKIDLPDVIQEVLTIYAGTMKGFEVSLEGTDGKWIYADIDGLKLILRNLIDNAVKNLPTTQGHIVISVAPDTDNEMVTMIIKDNGKGVDQEKLSTINQVFKNPHIAQIGQDKLGLGTLLIGKFVKKNKGKITVQSSPNQGSSFVLTLPQAA